MKNCIPQRFRRLLFFYELSFFVIEQIIKDLVLILNQGFNVEQKGTRITDLEDTFHFLHQDKIHLTLCVVTRHKSTRSSRKHKFQALNLHRIFPSRKLQQFQVLHFKNKWWERKRVYSLFEIEWTKRHNELFKNCEEKRKKRKKKGFARSEARKIVLCIASNIEYFCSNLEAVGEKEKTGEIKTRNRGRVNWKCYIEMKLL